MKRNLSISTSFDYSLSIASSFCGPLLLEVMALHATEKVAAPLLRRTFERGRDLYDEIFPEI